MQLWTGVFGKRFIGEDSPFRTDYEATSYPDGGHERSRRGIAKIDGSNTSGILINHPNDTAIISLGKVAIYIAQICYSDPGWDFHIIDQSYFDAAKFESRDNVFFSCYSCTYAVFDAAYAGCDVGDDCLTFDLEAGQHVFSTAVYEPNERTKLILCKITRNVEAVSFAPPSQQI